MYAVTQVIIEQGPEYFFRSDNLAEAIEQAEEGARVSDDGQTYRHHVINTQTDEVVHECGDIIQGA
jgi:hypothetical protein